MHNQYIRIGQKVISQRLLSTYTMVAPLSRWKQQTRHLASTEVFCYQNALNSGPIIVASASSSPSATPSAPSRYFVGGLFFGGLIDRTEAWASHISPNAGDASPLRSGNALTCDNLVAIVALKRAARSSLMAVLSDGNRNNVACRSVHEQRGVVSTSRPEQHNHVSWATFVTQKEYFRVAWPAKAQSGVAGTEDATICKFNDGSRRSSSLSMQSDVRVAVSLWLRGRCQASHGETR